MTKLNKEQLKEMQDIMNEVIAKRLSAMSEEDMETEEDEAAEQDDVIFTKVASKITDEEDSGDEDSQEEDLEEKNDTLDDLLNSESFQELAKACKEENKRSSFDKVADSVRDGADCFGELGEYIDEKFGVRIPMDPMPKPPFPPVPPTTPPVDFKTIGKVVGGTLGFGFGLLEVLSDKLSEW